MAEVKMQDGESIESALRRFKRKVQQEDIIKDIKKHSFYLKPGDKRRAKQALARKRNRKKQRRESTRWARARRVPADRGGTRWRPMEFQDKILTAWTAATEFVWTAGEQLFFADKNFKNEPKRCKSCKAKRAARPSGARRRRPRARGNDHQLLGLRQGNDRAVPSDAGAPGVLQGVLPVAEVCRSRRRLASATASRRDQKATPRRGLRRLDP